MCVEEGWLMGGGRGWGVRMEGEEQKGANQKADELDKNKGLT